MMTFWQKTCLFLLIIAAQAVFANGTTLSQPMTTAEFQRWMEENGYAPPAQSPAQVITTTTTVTKTPPVPKRPPGPITYEQEQKVMLASAPPNPNPPSQEAIIAFNAMLQQNMPLTPEQNCIAAATN